MLQIALWKRLSILLVCVIGLLLATPNLFYGPVERHNDAATALERGSVPTPEIEAALAEWPSFLPSGLVNLGLDLRGGAHLLAEVQLEDVYAGRIDGYWPEVRDTLRDLRGTIGTIRRQESPPDELRVRISQPEGMQAAVDAVRALASPIVSLTGVGQTDIDVSGAGDILTLTLSEAERAATDDRTLQQSLEIIRRRVDEAGTREPTIQRQGADRILIQVPGIGSAQELKELIGTTARLTFHPVIARGADSATTPDADQLLLPDMEDEGVFYLLERSPVVTGDDLVDSQPGFDQNGLPAVTFRFNPSGARAFGVYTSENIGAPFAIVLDEEVVTAPTIQSAITGGSGQITGNFGVDEANRLAILLRAGALPAELVFLEERTIGPELGQDSIDAGQIAALVAMAAVVVFMVLSYGLFGAFATLALGINVALIFGLLSLIGGTLTLPGIAGIVLTIGMAVDANVLVFERIREELKTAKGPARAIELGYEKALSAIVDANITTFIIAVILFTLGSGPVRGFAVTLGIGILTSVFTAIFVTRLLIVLWFERRRPRQIEV
ncbi:protein translocase subunit SecD [Jannaschia seohaensis]|uniref:Protein translocase subunit SecD n=1 Tax=Jannaschia seohaensis TaxID=475081 RepID=A0A2Y9C934_9RHOB|nr:protein translocase subunit SecD [Jannaschia seohaensis]PWJ12100.1 preprotein translocase subunit SecD [Jannaschia seohaensis]SSA51203.1 preprotein translocase subunit SecD [Jannaschia seohaensis]